MTQIAFRAERQTFGYSNKLITELAQHRRRPLLCRTQEWPSERTQSAATCRSNLATTSGCKGTTTPCLPVVLMCDFGSSMLRLSTTGPPADLMAAATSAWLTEPNSLPVPPVLTDSDTASRPSIAC